MFWCCRSLRKRNGFIPKVVQVSVALTTTTHELQRLTCILERAVESVGAPYNKFQELLGKISQQQVQVDNYSSLVAAEQHQSIEANLEMLSNSGGANHQQLAKVLDDLQRPINRMDDYLKSLQDQLQAAERLQILEWLSTLPYKKYHNQAQKNILQGTGAWFLKNKQLLEWRVSSFSSILWLHGIPGSGKTKLT